MKNLNTLKKAELIEMVKELQAKVEELTRVPEPETKPEETASKKKRENIMKKHEDIMNNHRVIGKPMSEDQLRAVLKQVAYYDITLTEDFCTLTVVEASELIKAISNRIRHGQVVKRKGHYDPDALYQKFMEKYPEAYDNIINRNL